LPSSAEALWCTGACGAGAWAWAWCGWCWPPQLLGRGRLLPPQGELGLGGTIGGVSHADEKDRNKPKQAHSSGGRKH